MKTPIIIAGMLCAFLFGAATVTFAGGAGSAPPPVRIHLDAAPTLQSATGSTPYSDAVEETREENVLRVLGAGLVYYFIRSSQLKHKLAAQHSHARPCVEQPATTASPSPPPTIAPSMR